jgi:hypothetical protein
MRPTAEECEFQMREHGKVEPVAATKDRLLALLYETCISDDLTAVLEGIIEMLPDTCEGPNA